MGFVRVFVFLWLFAGTIAFANVPERLEYQGYLTDAVGTPINCDSCATPYTFLFSIYDQQVGGALLWSEVHVDTDVIGGVFRVELGAQETIDAALLEGNSWLEIQINTQDPLMPRQRIVSVPYALRANVAEHAIESENAVTLGGQGVENFVTVTDTDVFITETELGDILQTLGFVPGDNDSLGDLSSCAVDEILKWDGGAWVCAVNADTDLLSTLLCAAGEIVQWDGTAWLCSGALDSLQASVDQVQANVDALDASLDPIAKDGLPADLLDGDDDTLLTEAEVLAMVAGAGYVMGDHFSGSWDDLGNIPADLLDGDTDTILTVAEVLAMVAGAGYITGDHFSGSWDDLSNIPADLADGDDKATDAEILAAVAAGGHVTGAHFSGDWSDLTGAPAAFERQSFHVHKGAVDQGDVSSGGLTRVSWPSTDFDTGSAFAADRFTCVVAGKYSFYAAVKLNGLGLYDLEIRLSKNGNTAAYTNYFIAYDGGANTGSPTMTVASVLDLAVGDYVEVHVHQESGGTRIIAGSPAATYFTGYRVDN